MNSKRSNVIAKVTGTLPIYPGVRIHLGARFAKSGCTKDLVLNVSFKGRSITSDIIVFEERVLAESLCNRTLKSLYEMLSQKWCKKTAKAEFEELISRQIASTASISIDGDRKHGEEVDIVLRFKQGRGWRELFAKLRFEELQFFFR